jgi:hypothetical protein
MQQAFLWSAAMASAITFAVHTFIGGRVVARPLLADRSLPKPAKWLAYYAWHITTVLLAAMAVAYAWAAWSGQARDLAVAVTGLAAALSILSAGVASKGSINPMRFPSTSLFALTACLGAAGLFVI